MNAWLAQATAESPYESDLRGRNDQLRSWLKKGDYKNPQDVNSFVNLTPLAQGKQMQDYSYGSTDAMASGANSQGAMDAQKIRGQSDLNSAWGGMYEDNAAGLRDQQGGIQSTLQNLHTNSMNLGVQGTAQMLQNIANRPKGFSWMGLLKGGIGAAASLI